MEAYIQGIGCISPQNTIDNSIFLENVAEYNLSFLKSIEPVYREYLNPLVARRLSRIIKMGMTSAMIAMKDSGIENPGGIITGTGLGCVEDTEKFLTTMLEHNETLLNPTNFMQSTYNTISSQIAIMLKCHNYNNTYVHRGFSFESSLQDALLLIKDNVSENVLVGGIDEMTSNHRHITGKTGFWKKEIISNLDLIKTKTKGSLAGEGAAFFLLNKEKAANSYCKINALSTFYKPTGKDEVLEKIDLFLKDQQIKFSDIDIVLLGLNGDVVSDEIYYDLTERNKENNFAYFKHLCGEYHTASAFSLWLAANILKNQTVPEVAKYGIFSVSAINNLLIYNHYAGDQHSLILLSKV
jgi:3-oxoacyl-(acyl-carrier-protein) synthase